MARATDGEWLSRLLDKFLTLDEYHGRDPHSERVIAAFWKGVGAHKKLMISKAKAAKKAAKPAESGKESGR